MPAPCGPSNATPSAFSFRSGNDTPDSTRVSKQLLKAQNIPTRTMLPGARFPVFDSSFSAELNDLYPPVYRKGDGYPGELVFDQMSLEKTWASLRKHLKTQRLSEQEVLDVLKSGLLQTDVGRSMADLFVEAMMRSIQPKGDLTVERLRAIVEVICHLPPDRWGEVFGERLELFASANPDSVLGFIQLHRNSSRHQLDELIANGELLSDLQWQCLRTTVRDCRSSIRPWREGRIESTLTKLEEFLTVRPSPAETRFLLGEFLQRLDETTQRERFPDRHKRAVQALWQNIELKSVPPLFNEWTEPAWLTAGVQHWVNRANSALNTLGALPVMDLGKALFNGAKSAGKTAATGVWASASTAVSTAIIAFQEEAKRGGVSVNSEAGKALADTGQEDGFSLLSALEAINQNADFFKHIDVRGTPVPQGGWAKLLYVLNVVDNARQLKVPVAGRPVLPGRPAQQAQPPVQYESGSPSSVSPQINVTVANAAVLGQPFNVPQPVRLDGTRPRRHAQENVASLYVGAFEQAERFARHIDELLTQSMHLLTGWHPVEAVEQTELVPLRTLFGALPDLLKPFLPHESEPVANPDSPYAPTVEPLEQQQRFIDTLYSDLGVWLQTVGSYLSAMGVSTLNSVTGIARQHPRAAATIAMATIYAAVHEFHKLRAGAVIGGPHFIQEQDAGLRGDILNEVETALSAMPSVDEAIRARIADSTFEDPHEDPRLVNDVAGLLLQPVPWNRSISSAELILEVAEHPRDDYFKHHDLAPLIDEGTTEPERTQRSKRAAEWVLETLNDPGALSTADHQLHSDVLTVLESNRNTPVVIPAGTLIHSSVELYKQAVNDDALLEFFTAKGLALPTLRIHHDRVTGSITKNGLTTLHEFGLWDHSGWWPAAKSLLPILKLLDPGDFGLCHLSSDSNAIPRDTVLGFYGVNPPSRTVSAQQIASQLKTSAWPAFSTAKKARLEKAIEQVEQIADVAKERALLVTALERVVKDKADSAPVTLSETMAGFVSRPLEQASQEIRRHLHDLLALPAMIELCQALKIDCSLFPVRLAERKIQVFSEGIWVDLTGAVNARPALKAALDKLFEQARTSGGALYSSTSADLLQVIRFRGFDAPKNVAEVRNIIGWLNTSMPPSPPLGNYGADWPLANTAPVTLSNAEKTQIIELSKVLLDGSPSIFHALGTYPLTGTSVEQRRNNAHHLLAEIFDTYGADAWGQQLVKKLNWYGATEGQTASMEHCQQLLCTAIKLSVDPDAPGKSGNIAGYDVYQPGNRGRELGAIRADIENHLISDKGVSALTAPLVAHLFLAEVAPEFLVPGGSNVHMGTVNWMTLRLGVAIVEATNQGCSRAMPADQLMALAVLDPATEESRLLFQSAGVDILVAWGVMNGVIRQRHTSSYSPGDYEYAAKMFARQRTDIAKALQTFSRPLQTRRDMAIIELRKVFPDASDYEIGAMKLWSKLLGASWNLQAAKGTTHDLVEVYMAGDLTPENWWQPSRMGMTQGVWETRIQALPDLDTLLTSSVDSYFAGFSKAFIAPTQLLFAELPLQDRQCIELGTIELFTLREETGRIKEDETRELQAAARGGYGTLIRCEHGGKISYFEVFPAQMKIIKRSDLPDVLPLNGVMTVEKVKVSKGSPVNAVVQRGAELPFDFLAYTTGAAPRTHVKSPKLIIEKLGDSFAATPLVGYADETIYVPNSYFSPKLARIINAVINDNFLQGQKAVLLDRAKGLTPRDKQKQFWENLKGFALQLIPFVGCVSDLSTGTRMGLINGVFGCFSDAVSSLSGLVGGVSTAVGVVKSVSPVKVKAFELMKISAGSVHSVINPLSGLPDLLSGTARGMRRFGQMLTSRVFDITQNGLGRLQTGLNQVRGFFGGAAGAAGKKMSGWVDADHALMQGIHRGTNTTAIHQNNKWYGVDNSGRPFGPALVGFIPLDLKLQQR